MIIAAFGIPGVGKSSIIKKVIDIKTDYIRLYWGELAFFVAQEMGKASDIDEVRKMDIRQQQHLQFDVITKMRKLIDADPTKNYIIETHAVIKTPQGYLPGFNKALLDIVTPEMFIVYQSKAQDIFQRRANDPTRKRNDDLTVEDIQQNLELTRSFATSYAVQSNGLLQIIENQEGNLDYAINKTVELLP
jgi:adenylate kinase